MSIKKLDVAVGIIISPQNQILIAERPVDKPHGLCWEFPGGKVEKAESIYDALCRELKEEVGIEVEKALAWEQHFHKYPDYAVKLHTYLVRDYQGEPAGIEGQKLKWIAVNELNQYTFPQANLPIMISLQNLIQG